MARAGQAGRGSQATPRRSMPRYPIYIPTKSRWNVQLTSRELSSFGVDHYLIVEPAQVADYRRHLYPGATILELDPGYQERYQTMDELGLTKSVGPGAARNFAWDHAMSIGARWHWVMDDNILGFYRYNRNLKTPVGDATILRVMEAFVERYDNVAMAGPHYFMFVVSKTALPPIVLNTRVYSCNLIRNDTPYRWRGRYNEDTDLSLRMLKDGWVTVLFRAFLADKMTTQLMGGGNTEAFYAEEGTMPKSRMLEEMHPDVAKVVWRFRRWHHHVDYKRFKQQLHRRPGVELREGTNDFGMRLEVLHQGAWIPYTSQPPASDADLELPAETIDESERRVAVAATRYQQLVGAVAARDQLELGFDVPVLELDRSRLAHSTRRQEALPMGIWEAS